MPAALDRWGLQAPIRHKSHRAKSRANTIPSSYAIVEQKNLFYIVDP